MKKELKIKSNGVTLTVTIHLKTKVAHMVKEKQKEIVHSLTDDIIVVMGENMGVYKHQVKVA